MEELLFNQKKRVPFYELPLIANDGSIRTFHKRIYKIKGIMAKDVVTGEVIRLSKIYYQIRTVKNKKGEVIAKRKNPIDELIRVN